jgi:hypothetical protein
MTPVLSLWLPVLVSAVLVFVASSVIHMALPWHRNDYPAVPDEDRALEALRPLGLPPGDYMVPRAGSMETMRTPAFKDKLARGPVLMMTVLPNGPFEMRSMLAKWFVFAAIVAAFAGFLASVVLAPGTAYGTVFEVVAVAAFMAYSLALWPFWIWYRRALGTTVRSTIDGLVYALLTGGTFGWLWPR